MHSSIDKVGICQTGTLQLAGTIPLLDIESGHEIYVLGAHHTRDIIALFLKRQHLTDNKV